VNKSFKDIYSTKLENWFEEIVMTDKTNKNNNFIAPTKELCISWIHKSFKEISDVTVINSWNVYKGKEIIDSSKFYLYFFDKLEQESEAKNCGEERKNEDTIDSELDENENDEMELDDESMISDDELFMN